MNEFERLLNEYRRPVERYVRIRLSSHADAEDVLQEIYLTAYRRFSALRDHQAFLAWVLAIARSKCLDYFRAKARQMELPMEMKEEILPMPTRHGRAPVSLVRETLSNMADREKRILHLYYFENLPQADIAEQLGIPLGTVKSRLYAAKERFRLTYPFPPRDLKGEIFMSKLMENGVFAKAKLLNAGDDFVTHGSVDKLRSLCGIDAKSIVDAAERMCENG